jgi:hypothetical protein
MSALLASKQVQEQNGGSPSLHKADGAFNHFVSNYAS